MLQALAAGPGAAPPAVRMMLANDELRTVLVTIHTSLRRAIEAITFDAVLETIRIAAAAARRFTAGEPRVAVAGLNPHAGEGGLFGRQDLDISTPVIADYVARGFDVVGPVPGDTVFVKLRGGQYDAVVAMYHDQGHIPVKLMGFKVDPATGTWNSLSGVNITLGLPIIRTSVDHGTAFDIAGQGIASETSLIEAIEYAERLAAART
jgi:4-hydroxythreonine-4-phosphate dehydrogenase